MQEYLAYKERVKQERLEEVNQEDLGDFGGSDPHLERSRFSFLKKKKAPSEVNTIGTNQLRKSLHTGNMDIHD